MTIALSLVVVAGNISASYSASSKSTACYNKKSGALRYLIKGKCKATEKSLNLGQTGAQGPAGATGATGPAGPAGLDGAASNVGATGPTGPTGATGPSGVSVGISAADIYYSSSLVPDNYPALLITRTNEVSNLGVVSEQSLLLAENSQVQVTSTLVINSEPNSNSLQETGIIECQLQYGLHNSALSGFSTMSWNRTNISEPSSTADFDGQLVLIGSANLNPGSYDLAIVCIRSANSPEVKISRMDLNAIAVG